MSFDEDRKKVVTGLLAAATDFGAETAMLEVSGMPLALLATGKAGRPTGFDGCMNETEIRPGLPKQDASGRIAAVSAVEVESRQRTNPCKSSPLRQASAQAVQLALQSRHSRMQRRMASRSWAVGTGCNLKISG